MDAHFVSSGTYTPGWSDYINDEYDYGEDSYEGELLIDGESKFFINYDNDPDEMYEFLEEHFSFKLGEAPQVYPYEEHVDFGPYAARVHLFRFEGTAIYIDGELQYWDDPSHRDKVMELIFKGLGIRHTHEN